MTEPSLEWKINQFVARLEKLDAGDRARLRRIAGARRADARGVESIFYRLVPPGLSDRQEEAFFLVATLFPLADGGSGGNIGQSLQRAAQKHPRMKKVLTGVFRFCWMPTWTRSCPSTCARRSIS